MKAMNVLSVDPGQSSSGFYVFDRTGFGWSDRLRIEDTDRPTWAENPQYWYLVRLRAFVRTVCLKNAPDMAIVEGYPFSMEASRSAHAIETGAIVREALTAENVPVLVMPIPLWKAAVRLKLPKKGRSNGGDENYLSEVERHFGRRFGTTDEADAFLMYRAALAIWRGEYASKAATAIRETMAQCAERSKIREHKDS